MPQKELLISLSGLIVPATASSRSEKNGHAVLFLILGESPSPLSIILAMGFSYNIYHVVEDLFLISFVFLFFDHFCFYQMLFQHHLG